MKIFLSILISTFAIGASASGTRVGDGGHGVTCPQSRTILFDLYEAQMIDERMGPWTMGDEPTVEMLIMQASWYIESVMGPGHFSQRIFDDALALKVMMRTVTGPLPPTFDLGATPQLLPGCEVKQVAVRGTGIMSGSLLVDADYWMNATATERAMLLIHEGAHSWFDFDDAAIFTGDSALRQFVGLIYTRASYPKTDAVIKELLESRMSLPRSALTEAALR